MELSLENCAFSPHFLPFNVAAVGIQSETSVGTVDMSVGEQSLCVGGYGKVLSRCALFEKPINSPECWDGEKQLCISQVVSLATNSG